MTQQERDGLEIPAPDPEWLSLWKQPDRSRILLDDRYAILSQEDADSLCQYSDSVPSGEWTGKMWRTTTPTGDYLRWYLVSGESCWTFTRIILIG